MNASEGLLAELLELDGWSCHPGYRVSITKQEKVAVGQHSLPDPEIDVLALKHGRVAWVESKTYLDSRGVQAKTLADGYNGAGRVRVFNDPTYREVVTTALLRQLRDREMVGSDTVEVEYWFAGWKFANPSNLADAQTLFGANGWTLLTPSWFVNRLNQLAETSYKDSTAAFVAKLLLRSACDQKPCGLRPASGTEKTVQP